jgi:hypothetical protein
MGEVSSCSLTTNGSLEGQFYNRTFDGFFRANGNEIRTQVKFYGSRGEFKRAGMSYADSLNCVRYLTVDESRNLASSLGAEAIDVSAYFDTSSCQAAILADWSVGSSRGRVLWCVPSYASGASIQGVYWGDLDWTETKFTDIWEGRWQ